MRGADEIENLLEAAKGLNASQQKELLARLSLTANAHSGQERDVDMWAGAVYSALVDADGAGGGGVPGPMVVKRLVTVSSAWAPVQAFMTASKLDSLQVTERQSVYGLLARLLVEHAAVISDKTGAPFSTKLVGNCATNISTVFDHAFPGYLKSGLAVIVARRLVSGYKPPPKNNLD